MSHAHDARLPMTWSGVFLLDRTASRVSSGGTERACFQSNIYLIATRRGHHHFYIYPDPPTSLLSLGERYRITGDILSRSNGIDTLLTTTSVGITQLDAFTAQRPWSRPVINVTGRGHVVRRDHRTFTERNIDRWVIIVMHNAWDDSLDRMAHFVVIYEASPDLIAQVGAESIIVGNIVNFQGSVITYARSMRSWVVELRALHVVRSAHNPNPELVRRASAT